MPFTVQTAAKHYDASRLPFLKLLVLTLLWFMQGSFASVALWWENPHDKWYLKDDWKAAEVSSYAPAFKLLSPAASGWIVIWGGQGVQLKVNGKPVMQHVDRGFIYDADLTPMIKGAKEVALLCGPGKIVAEGELVDDQGRRYPFASGCDWKTPVAPGARLSSAAKPYRPGESSGAFHSAHNGLLLRYNDEHRGQTEISKTLARIQKLRDQSIFLLRRFRPAEEILSFSTNALWRRAESAAAGPIAEAETILKKRAIPAQKEAKFADALALAKKAGALITTAELAVDSARELEEVERQWQHLLATADLMRSAGTPPPALQSEFAELKRSFGAARKEASLADWAKVQERAASARYKLASLSERLSTVWGASVGKLDEFSEDRFGWLNAPALMGNDPAQWEFSIVNPAANWIDLCGAWLFRTDPPNKGEELGWAQPQAASDGWRTIKVPAPWEREGVRDENDFSPADCPYKLADLRCEDKSYNGYAWYRREVLVPKSWAGRKVVLRVENVSNWLRVFVNGRLIAEPRRGGGAFAVPGDSLKFGQPNTLAIQVYNHDNFGGITGGPVSLAADEAQPEQVTTAGPLSFTTQTFVMTTNDVERTTTFASALSPAVVLVSDQSTLHFWGWEPKGFAPPSALTCVTVEGVQTTDWQKNAVLINGADLTDNWLLLLPGKPRSGSSTLAQSSPVLLVFEQRPDLLIATFNELGFFELTVVFPTASRRVSILKFDAENVPDAAACRTWARRLRAIPVACSELTRLDKKRREGSFILQYHYLDVFDFTDTSAHHVAPVPPLVTYALKNQFPGLLTDGFQLTGYASEHARYCLRAKTNRFSYTAPLIDKSTLLKGVGELFAKRKPELNARGGNTEKQMFDDWKTWGFDHSRYAFAWNHDWDIPLQKHLGSPLNDDPLLWQRMDDLIKKHTDRGLMAMLSYFFNEDQPQKNSKNLIRNSTRYWQMHPETRTNCYELWRRIAERYKDLPPQAVAYDFFNEPAYMHQDDWNQILKDLTRIVRSVDQKHLIVCEAGDGWSQPEWFLWLQPTGDTNTLYSFHHYGKHWGYHYDEYYPGYKATPEKEIASLLEAILFGIKHDVPLHCGEFGVSMISPGNDHLFWLDDYLALFERFGIGWNWWNWSGTDIYRTGLKAGNEVSPNLAVLRKWIERKKAWR